jgi:hypothetical protein
MDPRLVEPLLVMWLVGMGEVGLMLLERVGEEGGIALLGRCISMISVLCSCLVEVSIVPTWSLSCYNNPQSQREGA